MSEIKPKFLDGGVRIWQLETERDELREKIEKLERVMEKRERWWSEKFEQAKDARECTEHQFDGQIECPHCGNDVICCSNCCMVRLVFDGPNAILIKKAREE